MLIKKIAVLMGGWSPEREISIKSGKNVAAELRNLGFEVSEIDVKKDLRLLTDELYAAAPDFIFNVTHGIGGEDGILQGVLEVFGVPYSNSDVLGSAISFDKSICKKVVAANGVTIIDGFDMTEQQIKELNTESGPHMQYPFVVKSSANGSSVGVFLIFNDEDLKKLKDTKWTFGHRVMVEKYISGREFTVLVMDGKAIGALEITSKNKFYDFESKYDAGGSVHIKNYDLSENARNCMLEMAEKAYDACCCRGVARADFRYDGERFFFLEINTQPGMTSVSLVPDIAKFNGITFGELLLKYINK